ARAGTGSADMTGDGVNRSPGPGGAALRVVLVNCAFGAELADPDALLEQYHSLTGWAGALLEAGARPVTVVPRFPRSATIRRAGVDSLLVADGAPPYPVPWFRGRRVAETVARLAPDAVDVKGMVFPLLVRRLRARLGERAAIFVRDHGGFNADA